MDLIITSEDRLREIITECINNFTPPPLERNPEKIYLHSIAELARFLKCSPLTAQKLKNSGRIRYKQYGRKCIFNTEEVLDDLAKQKTPIRKRV